MPIIRSEPLGERGRKDARRHREKHKEAIKEKLPEIIADESIITGKRGKTVKIPIKKLDIPHFKPKRDEDDGDGVGIGQGPGQPGDVIDQRPGDGQPGEPGQEPGEDYIETEFEIEELIEMMFEDLGLPRLEEKEVKQLLVELGWKIHGISKSGPWPLLDRKKTAQEGFKRFWSYLRYLQEETGQDDLTCFLALKQAQGIVSDAIEIICSESIEEIYRETFEKIEPFPVLASDDLRFKKIEQDEEEVSQAVILAMRDISGSMTDEKIYLSIAMLYWLVSFLRKIYDRVVIRFIVHDTAAKIVDEDIFFSLSNGGGTNCYSAYELANSLIDTEYPTNKWNVYPWHFSDGEDGSPGRTIEEIQRLINKKVNMIGYGEVQPDRQSVGFMGTSTERNTVLWNTIKDNLNVQVVDDHGLSLLVGKDDLPFLAVLIEEREDVLPALKAFLKKDRWTK